MWGWWNLFINICIYCIYIYTCAGRKVIKSDGKKERKKKDRATKKLPFPSLVFFFWKTQQLLWACISSPLHEEKIQFPYDPLTKYEEGRLGAVQKIGCIMRQFTSHFCSTHRFFPLLFFLQGNGNRVDVSILPFTLVCYLFMRKRAGCPALIQFVTGIIQIPLLFRLKNFWAALSQERGGNFIPTWKAEEIRRRGSVCRPATTLGPVQVAGELLKACFQSSADFNVWSNDWDKVHCEFCNKLDAQWWKRCSTADWPEQLHTGI